MLKYYRSERGRYTHMVYQDVTKLSRRGLCGVPHSGILEDFPYGDICPKCHRKAMWRHESLCKLCAERGVIYPYDFCDYCEDPKTLAKYIVNLRHELSEVSKLVERIKGARINIPDD
jgi:hypothetical protein